MSAAITRVSLLFLIASLLGACASSPPIDLYTLVPMPSSSKSPMMTSGPVRLTRVRIPGEIDRRELVQRIDATRLELNEQHHWAAPLDELIGRVLETDLEARLGKAVVNDVAAADASQRSLSVDIRELLADASCRVSLRAEWTLTGAAGEARRGSESIDVAPEQACSIAAIPMTMSRALAELSDRIAAGLK